MYNVYEVKYQFQWLLCRVHAVAIVVEEVLPHAVNAQTVMSMGGIAQAHRLEVRRTVAPAPLVAHHPHFNSVNESRSRLQILVWFIPEHWVAVLTSVPLHPGLHSPDLDERTSEDDGVRCLRLHNVEVLTKEIQLF